MKIKNEFLKEVSPKNVPKMDYGFPDANCYVCNKVFKCEGLVMRYAICDKCYKPWYAGVIAGRNYQQQIADSESEYECEAFREECKGCKKMFDEDDVVFYESKTTDNIYPFCKSCEEKELPKSWGC